MISRLRKILKSTYHHIRGFGEKYLFGSFLQKLIWKTKYLCKGEAWTTEHWQRSENEFGQNQLSYYGDCIEKHFGSPQSILDFGCETGVNCHVLSLRFKETTFYGVDVSSAAIAFGKKKVAAGKSSSRIHLNVISGNKLQPFADKSIDLVLTSAVLFYLAPDDLHKLLKEMLRVAQKGVIFFELQKNHDPRDPHGKGTYEGGHWMRNLADALAACGVSRDTITEEKIPLHLWGGSAEKAYCTIAKLS